MHSRFRNNEEFIEVQSDLFRESGVNASTSDRLIEAYADAMRYAYRNSWGAFPPIHGVLQTVLPSDWEDWLEASEGGYEHELAWSRPLEEDDIGLEYVAIEDGHNRSYAARSLGVSIRVKVWKLEKNNLDPTAWLTEKHPFDMPGETADIRLGVHATDSFDAAVAYAVHKASQEGDLDNGKPNCGIVFELDMSGLEPLPEADALVVKKDEDVVIKAIREVVEEARPRNNDELADAVGCFAEMMLEDSEPEDPYNDWFTAFWIENVYKPSPWTILNVLIDLADNESEYLATVIKHSFKHGEFPLEVWARAIGQYRYMSSVGHDRLLRVWAIRPVNDLLNDCDFTDDYDDEPMTFSQYEIGVPDRILMWDSGRRVDDPMYHGTDISRARSAFPEIGKRIVSPWSYGQPEGVGPR